MNQIHQTKVNVEDTIQRAESRLGRAENRGRKQEKVHSYGHEGRETSRGRRRSHFCSDRSPFQLISCLFILPSPRIDVLGQPRVRSPSPKCGPGNMSGVTQVINNDTRCLKFAAFPSINLLCLELCSVQLWFLMVCKKCMLYILYMR